MREKTKAYILCVMAVLLCIGLVAHAEVDESLVNELKENISDRTSKIEELEEEIKKYEAELQEVGKEKESLQGAIRSLDLSQEKIEVQQNITRNKVSQTNFEISKLTLEINDKEERIQLHRDTLAASLRTMNAVDEETFLETMLGSETLADLWKKLEDLEQFQATLQANLQELRSLKEGLIVAKAEQEGKRADLVAYDDELTSQDQALQATKNEKSSLLKVTQNKESNYKTLLEEKKEARAQFERELLDFESQLQIAIDPSSIPSVRRGVLSWPVDNVRITQRFGNTAFAQSGAYNGQGHNGIDFGVPTGSKVKAALSGTVQATGNTDAIPGCYSYGKWMLVKHNNGLSTLYAHLSHISLNKGASVKGGQTIGYSGNTGYSTGPHLHFTVYASQGVKIVRYGDVKQKTNCADAMIPVAPHAAYLDPLSYLPE